MSLPREEVYEKFMGLLEEMFQMDAADLDFGLYRIMRAKRAEVKRFLEEDLFSKIDEVFRECPEINAEEARKDVFAHLLEFFSRYYHEGDFMSLRRRKWHNYTYAIPYNGEEVKLYWANHDQYYIKTSEYFRNYTFRLERLGWKVTFEVVFPEASRDNLKGGKRVFVPLGAEVVKENGKLKLVFKKESDKPPVTVSEEEKRLIVRFTFREVAPESPESTGRGRKAGVNQDEINAETAKWLVGEKTIPMEVRRELEREVEVKNNKSEKVRLVDRHLRRFTRRNTFDFFIHKNLKEFLTRELDFYLKSEVVDLSVLETLAPEKVKAHLCLAKAIRLIGEKIIEFLSQIEDFQKKLWLKKKFIWDTQYCITIDRIFDLKDEERREWLLEKIFVNRKQIEEWKELYRVHELDEGELFRSAWDNSSPEALRKLVEKDPRLRHLVVDTRHFDDDFKLRLISSFDNLDEELDGLLVHGENFQALNLLLERYRGQVKCIYIDPPYNTGNDEFVYKDNYQHSSWLTMMENRLNLAKEIMKEDAAIFISIDDNEIQHLRKISDTLWSRIGTFVWEKKKKGSHLSSTFRDLTEYVLAYSPNLSKLGELYGEKAYSGKWQYLINRANAESELLFPAGQIEAALEDGEHPAGTYGEGEMAVILLDSIKVKDGIIQNSFRMRARFKWKQETLDKELAAGSIIKLSKNMRPNVLRADQEEKTKRPPSLITKDIAAYEDAFAELKNFFGDVIYAYPKPTGLVKFFVNTLTYFKPEGIILDYFAGSGTTAHAVINLNREDGGKRKYILVEVANYFDTVLLPRIKKVVFSRDWKNGRPKSDERGNLNSVSHFFKYIRLESYEDTLNNLEPLEERAKESKEARTLQQALERACRESPKFCEDFMLHYLLDFETCESPSLLPIEAFKDPWAYTLDIATEVVGETRPVKVDLVETFNYLLGLRVKHISEKERFTVPGFYRDEYRKLRVKDNRLIPVSPEKPQSAAQEGVWTFQTVEGELPDGRRALVIWRTLSNDPEKDCAVLETFMEKKGYAARDTEFDVIYINGQHTLPGPFKVHRTEFEFKDRMFTEIEV